MQVTAEGVETIDQRDHLTAIGCHELQGFLMSRPLSPSQLTQLMLGQKLPPTDRWTA